MAMINPFFKRVYFIYTVLMISSFFIPILFTGLMFVYHKEAMLQLEKFVLYLIFIFCVADLLLSNYLYKFLINSTKNAQELKEKAMRYQSAKILQAAVMLLAIDVASVFLFMTNEIFFIAIFPMGWFLFFMNRPSPDQFADDFELNPQERNQVFHRDFNI